MFGTESGVDENGYLDPLPSIITVHVDGKRPVIVAGAIFTPAEMPIVVERISKLCSGKSGVVTWVEASKGVQKQMSFPFDDSTSKG